MRLLPEQVQLAARAVDSAPRHGTLLVRIEEGDVDWAATATRVRSAAIHVYLSLLLLQARREERGIVAGSLELALRRQQAVACLARLQGKRVTAQQVISLAAGMSGMELPSLRPLGVAIRRDLARLQSQS